MTITTSFLRFLMIVSLVAMSAYSHPIRGSQRAEPNRHRRLQMGMDEDTSAPSTFVSDFPSGSPSITSSEVPTLDLVDAFDSDTSTAIPTDEPTKEPKKSKGNEDDVEDGDFARTEDYDITEP